MTRTRSIITTALLFGTIATLSHGLSQQGAPSVGSSTPDTAPSAPAAKKVVLEIVSAPQPQPVLLPTANAQPKAPTPPTASNPNSSITHPSGAMVQSATYSRSLLSLVVKATAYTSLRHLTDSSPFRTATGAGTSWGVVALSRDLLAKIPYGSRIRIEDLSRSNPYRSLLAKTVFIVEDTMNARMRQKIDVWFPAHSQAIQWGVRNVRITVLRLGR